MYRKIAIAGATAAVILGSGTAALATSGSTSPSPTPSSTSTHAKPKAGHGKPKAGHGKHPRHELWRAVISAQFVTHGKDGKFVTHDVTRGQVSTVSSSAVTVKEANGKTQLYKITSSTKVRVRTSGKGAPGAITDVHVGDQILVAGTGTGTPTATHLVDGKK